MRLALVLLLCACGSTTKVPTEPQPKAVPLESDVVTVTGTARNAKMFAGVEWADGFVYCKNIASWPDDREGKQVTVSGKLERTDDFKAETGPNGEVSQGTAGGDMVMEECEVALK
jgi:hypothetical protein